MKCLSYASECNDPYTNLAIEQMLLTSASVSPVIFLWRNKDCIVFGRNQNIYAECNVELMQQLGVCPVRRLTGGGAVFHDMQNLNFSFVVPKEIFDKKKSMEIVQNALFNCQIAAQVSGRNDILVDDMKVSGSAYYSTQTHVLHHGTLLIDVDLAKMERLLAVPESKLQSHGVRSVRSRVCNLKVKYPEYSISDYEYALKEAFAACYGGDNTELCPYVTGEEDSSQISELRNTFGSDEWIYGYSQKEDCKIKKKFSWGFFSAVYYCSEAGKRYIRVYSDTLYSEEFNRVKICLEGMECSQISSLRPDVLKTASEVEKNMLKDILLFISEEGI